MVFQILPLGQTLNIWCRVYTRKQDSKLYGVAVTQVYHLMAWLRNYTNKSRWEHTQKGCRQGIMFTKKIFAWEWGKAGGKDTVQNWLEEGREGRNRCFQSQGLARKARGAHEEGREPDVFSICNWLERGWRQAVNVAGFLLGLQPAPKLWHGDFTIS